MTETPEQPTGRDVDHAHEMADAVDAFKQSWLDSDPAMKLNEKTATCLLAAHPVLVSKALAEQRERIAQAIEAERDRLVLTPPGLTPRAQSGMTVSARIARSTEGTSQ